MKAHALLIRERVLRFLERSFAGRCVYRFLELDGVDRALALASRAFIAVIPLAVVATAVTPTGESFGDRLVERFELNGEAAETIRQLFVTPPEARGAATVVGLAALLVTCLSFARLLQRTYERIWRLEPAGPRAVFRGLAWIVGFAAWLAFVVPMRNWLRDLGDDAFYVVVTAAASTVLWIWTPYVLLGGRISWRRLLPSALVRSSRPHCAHCGLDALHAYDDRAIRRGRRPDRRNVRFRELALRLGAGDHRRRGDRSRGKRIVEDALGPGRLRCDFLRCLHSLRSFVADGRRRSRRRDSRSPSGTRRSSGSSSSPRSAATASRTSRSTSTCSSTSRPSRCAGPGTPSTSSRSARARTISPTSSSTTSTSPGTRSSPGCDYERWERRLRDGSPPTVYAHVATDPGHPGQLALQYWLFYTYNDWNNLHEGDWEMIQLVFDAADAEEALGEEPVAVGYSQHEGAERAEWGEEKLELVDGRRPVVYPAAGSHANFFDDGAVRRQLRRAGRRLRRHARAARRARAGGRHDPERPRQRREPRSRGSRSRAAGASSRTRSSTARPGPNLKTQWTEPIDVVGGVADAQLRGADRRRLRHRRDRLLLRGGRDGLARARHAGCGARSRRCSSSPRDPRARRLRRRPRDLAPRRAAARRAPACLGADPRRRRPHVRRAHAALPRHRRSCFIPLAARHLDPPGARARRVRPARRRHDRGGRRRPRRCSCSRSGRPSRCSGSPSSRRRPPARSCELDAARRSARSRPTGWR